MAPTDEPELTALAIAATVGDAALCDPDEHDRVNDEPPSGFATSTAMPMDDGLTPEQIMAFSEKWQLDKESKKYLLAMASDLQKAVVSDFSPSEGTQNVNAKFCVFAKRRAARVAPLPVGVASLPPSTVALLAPVLPPGLQPMGADGAPGAHDADDIAAFASRWELGGSSVALLRSLPRDVLRTLLDAFAPAPGTRNVHGKLQAYAQRLLRGARATGAEQPPRAEDVDPAAAFASRWSLDSGARDVLHALPADVQARVIADFRSAIGSADVSRQLCTFAELRSSEFARGRRVAPLHSGGQAHSEAPPAPVGAAPARSSARLGAKTAAAIGQAGKAAPIGQVGRSAERSARQERPSTRPKPPRSPPPTPPPTPPLAPSHATRWERDSVNSWTPSLAASYCR